MDGIHDCGGFQRQNSAAIDVKPVKKCGITQKPIFDHFSIASAQFPIGQACQKAGIGKHGLWLVEGTNQIFTRSGIHAGFTTNRTINLRQKACWDLNKINAAQQAGGGKASQITNNPATKGNQQYRPIDANSQNIIKQLCQNGH